jgi:hypothetical protein
MIRTSQAGIPWLESLPREDCRDKSGYTLNIAAKCSGLQRIRQRVAVVCTDNALMPLDTKEASRK